MLVDLAASAIIVLVCFVIGYLHPDGPAIVAFGLLSSIAWSVGSTVPAPPWWNSNLNILAAAFADAALGFTGVRLDG